MDLGLNHVVRKHSIPVDDTAHRLIPVPADLNRPGGLLLLTAEAVIYKRTDHPDVKALLPRRHEMDHLRETFINCFATMNTRDEFFFLISSDNGDLFKVTVNHTGAAVHAL